MKSVKNLTAALLIVALAGCTSYRAFERAQELEELQDWDAAIVQYAKALEVDPENLKYKAGLSRAKLEASRLHFEKGKALRLAGKADMAAVEFQIVVNLDPTNQFAAIELLKAQRELDSLRQRPESIAEMKKRVGTKAQPPQLNPASDEPISLSFPRETSIKDIYRALGNSFGINILFDQAVKDDRITIELRDVTAQQALERVMQAGNHFYKVLDERSIIVAPDNPQARRDYEDLVIQTFYLSNGDAEQVTNVVRTMIEARNVFPLKALNAITIRDTADKVRIAEKIIAANDKARAEVVVDVELLQLDLTKARELGLQISGQGSINILGTDGTALTGGVTAGQLQNLGSDNISFTLPSASYSLLKTNTDSRLLAKPQLRISEGEKASLHIGQKIPVPVSTFTAANPGNTGTYAPVTSFQYQDVGIKISLEPRVHHNREVTLKLSVEVSNLAGEKFGGQGQPSQPIIGTRTIESTIRLKDGETNFLAGLIRKDETQSRGTTPFLGDIPLLGRLFTKEKDDTASTDLVLTMTPHIIRIADITDEDIAPMWVGTTNNLTFRGVSPRMESPNNGDPFVGRATPDQFGADPTSAGEFPVRQDAQPNPIYLPPGSAPTDVFEPPPRDLPPAPPQPVDEPRPDDGLERRLNVEAQKDAFMTQGIFPRIAPQPATLTLKPGETRQWKVVGMDLDGVRTTGISMQFDPRVIDVANVVLGPGLNFDPMTPPAITLDKAAGTISIRSTDGKPLLFRAGGEIIVLEVRGALPGESYLVLSDITATRADGSAAPVVVSGGRSRVE